MAEKKLSAKQVGIGAGVAAAAAAAAAAGYYFYASEEASKHRRIASKWAADFKRSVMAQARKVGDLDRAQMLAIIDKAASAYETARSVDPRELERATKELRANWQELVSEMHSRVRGAARSARTTAKRGTKKAAKRAKKASKKRGRST